MKIKEAKQLLEDHSITEENFGGFKLIWRDGISFLPLRITTKQVRSGHTSYNFATRQYDSNYKAVTAFVSKRVNFSADGTWTINDEELLLETAKCEGGYTINQKSAWMVQDHQRKVAMQNRLGLLPPTEEIADALSLGEANVSYDARAQKYTITLTLAQMETLLGQDVK